MLFELLLGPINMNVLNKVKHPVHEKFDYNEETGKSKCKICNIHMTGKHSQNLCRHLKRKHEVEFDEIMKNKRSVKLETESYSTQLSVRTNTVDKTISVNITVDKVKDACVELVTVNGRPFAMLEDSGFRKLIDPILEGLGNKLQINRQNMQEEVMKRAHTSREELSNILQNRLISLKVDSATRLDRSVLGINLQFIEDEHVVTKTLAMREMFERSTSSNLCNIIINVLKEYKLSVKQIYSLTSDNGANMIKATKLLAQEQILDSYYSEDEDEDYETAVDVLRTIDVCECEDNFHTMHSQGMLVSVRCAAHSLQLAVRDILKTEDLKNIVNKARLIVKKLRTTTILISIKREKLKKPILDCETRWSSTYMMLKRLLELNSFCVDLAVSIKELHLSESNWVSIEKIVNILEPVKIASDVLQSEQLTITDFYNIWTKCKLKVKKIEDNEYSPIMLKALKARETYLMESGPLVACNVFRPTISNFIR